jgi:hypothetical protein
MIVKNEKRRRWKWSWPNLMYHVGICLERIKKNAEKPFGHLVRSVFPSILAIIHPANLSFGLSEYSPGLCQMAPPRILNDGLLMSVIFLFSSSYSEISNVSKRIYYTGIKIYNNLPVTLEQLSYDISKCKSALKRSLLTNSPYSLEEYFRWK